jgi:hypothetical protein
MPKKLNALMTARASNDINPFPSRGMWNGFSCRSVHETDRAHARMHAHIRKYIFYSNYKLAPQRQSNGGIGFTRLPTKISFYVGCSIFIIHWQRAKRNLVV